MARGIPSALKHELQKSFLAKFLVNPSKKKELSHENETCEEEPSESLVSDFGEVAEMISQQVEEKRQMLHVTKSPGGLRASHRAVQRRNSTGIGELPRSPRKSQTFASPRTESGSPTVRASNEMRKAIHLPMDADDLFDAAAKDDLLAASAIELPVFAMDDSSRRHSSAFETSSKSRSSHSKSKKGSRSRPRSLSPENKTLLSSSLHKSQMSLSRGRSQRALLKKNSQRRVTSESPKRKSLERSEYATKYSNTSLERRRSDGAVKSPRRGSPKSSFGRSYQERSDASSPGNPTKTTTLTQDTAKNTQCDAKRGDKSPKRSSRSGDSPKKTKDKDSHGNSPKRKPDQTMLGKESSHGSSRDISDPDRQRNNLKSMSKPKNHRRSSSCPRKKESRSSQDSKHDDFEPVRQRSKDNSETEPKGHRTSRSSSRNGINSKPADCSKLDKRSSQGGSREDFDPGRRSKGDSKKKLKSRRRSSSCPRDSISSTLTDASSVATHTRSSGVFHESIVRFNVDDTDSLLEEDFDAESTQQGTSEASFIPNKYSLDTLLNEPIKSCLKTKRVTLEEWGSGSLDFSLFSKASASLTSKDSDSHDNNDPMRNLASSFRW